MKILIIDREYLYGWSYAERFKKLGHECLSLVSGLELMRTIKKEKPDVLILGVKVPGYESDPFVLLDLVKTSYPELTVIYNTSLDQLWQFAKAKGADCYSEKSLDFDDLAMIIKQIEAKRKGEENDERRAAKI